MTPRCSTVHDCPPLTRPILWIEVNGAHAVISLGWALGVGNVYTQVGGLIVEQEIYYLRQAGLQVVFSVDVPLHFIGYVHDQVIALRRAIDRASSREKERSEDMIMSTFTKEQ